MMELSLLMTHRHGNDWVEMTKRRDLDAADLDPERGWAKDGAVYQCPCGEEVIVGPTTLDSARLAMPRG